MGDLIERIREAQAEGVGDAKVFNLLDEAAAALSQQRAVPEEWRWVPVAATAEMWEAGMNCWSPDDTQGDYLEKAWEAMLAAAPSPEQEK